MCLKVEKDLKDLGADVIRQGHGQDTHSNGWNLLCTLKGSPGLSPLILSAHLDTVSPGKGIEPLLGQDGVLRSKGPTILGGDDKCGAAGSTGQKPWKKTGDSWQRTMPWYWTPAAPQGAWSYLHPATP